MALKMTAVMMQEVVSVPMRLLMLQMNLINLRRSSRTTIDSTILKIDIKDAKDALKVPPHA